MRIRSLAVLFALVLPVEGQAPKKSAPPKAAPAAQPTLKAIWEPVNFPKDIDLYDIDCPAPEECWAVGDRSTIIHTTDGGKNWTAQLGGDTGATDPKMEELFFLDTKYGWASRADDKLFQTTDGGASWTEAGRQPLGGRRYNFVSPQTGYAVHWNEHELLRTDDGGKSWKQHAECKVSFQQRGLARETRCSFRDMDFSTPSNGYVTGLVPDAGGRGIVGTTKDGGATWLFSSPDVLDEVAEKGFFWGANGGIVGLTNNKNLLTTDGGATWTPIISPVAAWESVSGSPGGSFVVSMDRRASVSVAYSTNGGKTFSGRPFPLPATPNEVTFADAGHGYLVGDHGMVYRYRIVPENYTAAGMIGAVMSR